ncbi:hypothetical protein ACFQY4_26720 [Catellatospora bangladeshensis]|uniref:hypothetical protein n=1 Tax=Catellatospora bangladeshensis TaxID=310355 RepID=UPI00361ACA5A
MRLEILRNIRRLEAYRQGLDPELRQHFEVRLYAASASVTIYRWDSRMLVSFLPLGRLSGDTAQLEVSSESPLGTFVGERFDDLWRHGTPIEDHVALHITLMDGTGSRDYVARFVVLDDEHYIADPRIIAHLARHRDGTITARLGKVPSQVYALHIVAEESDVMSDLNANFLAKYERPGAAFIRLVPDHPPTRSDPT